MYRAKPISNNHLVLGPRRSLPELRRVLDGFVAHADRSALLKGDPVQLVHRYGDPHDQEVVGIAVAMLAYGRVASILKKAEQVLDALGPHPARAIREPTRLARLSGFVHRFQRGEDIPRFLRAVACVRDEAGSLARAFESGMDPAEGNYVTAMSRFIGRLRGAVVGRLTPGLTFLLPQPSTGGAAKRLCLFLRWMVRPADGIDLGTWSVLASGLSPAKLVVPLDTHIERIARYLGLTDRLSSGLDTALEITASLAALSPDDPLVYDVALCHLGISGRCPRRRDVSLCADCPIRAVCRLGEEPPSWPFRQGGSRRGAARTPRVK